MAFARFQLRRGTATEWTTADPILEEGELAFETDTNRLKTGDGTSLYSVLPYSNIPSATQVGVLSFSNLAVSGQDSVVADSATDTLTLAAGVNTRLATDAASDTVTFHSMVGTLQTVTATGAGSFVVPANVTRLRFRIVGGGGAGGGNPATANTGGGGGGSGAYIEHIVNVTPGDTINYSVGTGGTGASNATGGAGASTTITINGVTYTAGGGSGGTTSTGGAGGTASGGTPIYSVNGQQGGGGSTAAISGTACNSGGSPFKGYGRGGLSQNNATGASGSGFGAGGGGSVTTAATARAGGNGTAGLIELEY